VSGAAPRFLAFRAGRARLALPLAIIREVIERPEIVPVPGSRDHVSGVTLNRGVALPVYDLRRVGSLWTGDGAGAAEDVEAPTHLIVCGLGEILLGVQAKEVDLLEGASLVEEGECPVEGGFLRGRLSHRGGLVALLDPARLFASLGVPADALSSVREGYGEEDPAGR
jgi:chemotaxis signal transduction protein